MDLISQSTGAASLWLSLPHLRSVGQIVVGIADNSLVPMPGSLDVFTIWLAASNPRLWFYYAAMATVGSLVGGFLTYLLAREGGRQALERKLTKKRAQKIYRQFERWGTGAVTVPAVLPPPFPIVPSLLAAGALQYPPKRFIGALALGRGVRFTVISALGALYGKTIASFFSRYYKPALLILVGVAVLTAVVGMVEYYRYKQRPQ